MRLRLALEGPRRIRSFHAQAFIERFGPRPDGRRPGGCQGERERHRAGHYRSPFVVLMVASRRGGLNGSLEHAVPDLGTSTEHRRGSVVSPLIASVVVAATLLALTVASDQFNITKFTIGGANRLPVYMLTPVRTGITPRFNVLASLLFVATLCVVGLGVLLGTGVNRLRHRELQDTQAMVGSA